MFLFQHAEGTLKGHRPLNYSGPEREQEKGIFLNLRRKRKIIEGYVVFKHHKIASDPRV